MVRLPHTPDEVERGQRLGALLRRARGDRPLIDTALSAGVSPETLRKIETGRVATPAFPTVAAIAQVVGLSLDDIWAQISRPGPAGETAEAGSPRRERVAPQVPARQEGAPLRVVAGQVLAPART